ncbi:MAG: cysteine-rich KTR domain-containing protein [Christensenellales bacterium]|uniref:Cysteine-rich KTR domain-containing protein n=1 Tax=Candidatus Avichristensenella intestinipullorum TaxID=2840693 RepID=A0A9D0YX88_9FIRM|nr:cysteine-rich KTR domain-containing protein [Christensenellales bacterium]HIQ63764.1 cysteine-rich KTR domain-containing protein [Candidatus Avichristensenella intestinipullorum]
MADDSRWLLCPVCHGKTRVKVRADTDIRNLPLFCPKCRRETLIHVKQRKVFVAREPDAQAPDA